MERSLSETAILNKASLKYKITVFPSTEPWHIVWGEFSRRVNFGTLIFRLGYGYRFEQGAVAMEANGYINIRSGTYVHASFLFSGSTIFPRYAIGVEPYQSLPYGFELSLGARYMDWTTSNLVIWTGSLGKYLSNFWLAYRFYYSAKAERSSFSSALYIRRYLTDTDNYLTLRLGLGLTDYNEIEDQELSGFNSRGAALEVQLAIIPLLYFKAEILYSNYEYYRGKFRDRYGLEIGIQKRF
jgi:YaiO family outer membrane protein